MNIERQYFRVTFIEGKGLHLRVVARIIQSAQIHNVRFAMGRASETADPSASSVTGLMLLGLTGKDEGRLWLEGFAGAISRCVDDLRSFLPTVRPEDSQQQLLHSPKAHN